MISHRELNLEDRFKGGRRIAAVGLDVRPIKAIETCHAEAHVKRRAAPIVGEFLQPVGQRFGPLLGNVIAIEDPSALVFAPDSCLKGSHFTRVAEPHRGRVQFGRHVDTHTAAVGH